MTRIVAGSARGRRLVVPPAQVRPTSSRTREAVFSAVGHRIGGWDGANVLDLFAGSGAMGLEAASRGAASVVLVEQDRRVLATLRANVATVACPGVAVIHADAYRLRPRAQLTPTPPAVDVAIIDPPYRDEVADIARLLQRLATDDWLTPAAVAVIERPARDTPISWPPGWESLADRRYADSMVFLGRLVTSPQRS